MHYEHYEHALSAPFVLSLDGLHNESPHDRGTFEVLDFPLTAPIGGGWGLKCGEDRLATVSRQKLKVGAFLVVMGYYVKYIYVRIVISVLIYIIVFYLVNYGFCVALQ